LFGATAIRPSKIVLTAARAVAWSRICRQHRFLRPQSRLISLSKGGRCKLERTGMPLLKSFWMEPGMSEKKKWTVMIYLAGDNNLSDEMIWALKEIYRVGTGGCCNVVVQFDPSATEKGPRRYDITKIEGKYKSGCDQDGIIELESIMEPLSPTGSQGDTINQEDSTDQRVLAGFVNYAMQNKEAEHYMLILSGHGSGVMGGMLDDQNPYGRLTIRGLGNALKNALVPKEGTEISKGQKHPKIDILGLDSCTMSTAEVAHEVRDSVDFLVGSEGFIRNAGWPYHRLLETMHTGPDADLLAIAAVKCFIAYYSDYLSAGVSTDQAAAKLEAFRGEEPIMKNLTTLSVTLADELHKDNRTLRNALVLAHWDAQSFNNEQYVDLYDFCARLLNYLPEGEQKSPCESIRLCCQGIIESWQQIVLKSDYSGPAYQHAHGLSIYFPWSELCLDYAGLSFAEATKWYDFLKVYIDKTVREVRDDEGRAQQGERPESIQAVYAQAFVGIGGYPVHRAGGWDGVKAGGWNGVKGGGWLGAKGGGWLGAKYGSLTADETVSLSSMKNSPVGFYPRRSRHLDEIRKEIALRDEKKLEQQLLASPDKTLQRVINRLPEDKKKWVELGLRPA